MAAYFSSRISCFFFLSLISAELIEEMDCLISDDDGYLSEKDTYDITDSDEDLFPSDTQTTCPGNN